MHTKDRPMHQKLFCFKLIILLTITYLLPRLLESICFSIGSAYFVTGSYPEGSLVAGDNDYWDNFESAPPDVTDFEEPNPFFVGKNVAIGSSTSGVKVVGGSSSSVGYMKVNTEEKEEELRLKLLDNDQLHHY